MRSLVSVAVACAALASAAPASAFCGFYVAGADSKLFADATQVVLMREGTRTVLSMQNDYKGPPEKFAMVVPVPVVLQKNQVKTLDRAVFDKVDKLGAPRLVEYWEQDPCAKDLPTLGLSGVGVGGGGQGFGTGLGSGGLGVKVEARYAVGEYDVVILGASDSAGLETWLRQEKYEIPAGAEPFLRPYVQQGMKFFVAKVDPTKVKLEDGRATLSPIRFHYDSETFSLPVKLGLINSSGKQDLIVNILARQTRYDVANYPNVTIPTNLDLAEQARGRFGELYAALFDRTIEKTPRAVVTEYAWDAGMCDPCPGPTLDAGDLATLGEEVLARPGRSPLGDGSQAGGGSSVSAFTAASSSQPKVTQGLMSVTGKMPREVVQRVVRARFGQFRFCYERALTSNPKLEGRVTTQLTVGKDGAATDVKTLEGSVDDEVLRACTRKAFSAMQFPTREGGEPVGVTFTLQFAPPEAGSAASPASPPPPRPIVRPQGSFVLTRLHLRYAKDALGEDLVFKAAPAIAGGREVWNDGKLETGSQSSSANNFQARYAIRHPWTGPVACDAPRRGLWGGPPDPDGGVLGALFGKPPPAPAQKLAFAPRGNVELAALLRSSVPELGVTASAADGGAAGVARTASADASVTDAAADADADAGADAARGNKGCGACATVEAPADASFRALVASVVAALSLATRRRRRRPRR